MTDRSDDKLMADYVEGDESALRVLVERWERPVFAFLARMLESPEEAEDLCQDTFMRVMGAADRYKPEGRFRSWLFRIAGNQARTRLRRRKVLRWLPLTSDHDNTPAAGSDAFDKMAGQETRELVRGAMARLPERQRQALILKQYHEMDYREIAAAMDTTVASVQMLLHRAMTALRKDMVGRRDKG